MPCFLIRQEPGWTKAPQFLILDSLSTGAWKEATSNTTDEIHGFPVPGPHEDAALALSSLRFP